MHVHILGVCGTFMGGLALIARQLGFRVTGSDQNVYPPMSTQLEQSGIELHQGYDESILDMQPDQIVVGNVMTRGHAVIEALLERGLPLISGPGWLYQHVLCNRWVIAVSGTHGKTTTTAMIASILRQQNLQPGYLIGGVANEFGQSADLGADPFFVIEGDEYDTAFFDKRSKFLHYRPRTLVINNIEFDHADIFDDLPAIQKQFHHMLKIMPAQGKVIFNADDANIQQLLTWGCWSEQESFGMQDTADLQIDCSNPSRLMLSDKQSQGSIDEPMPFFGVHNLQNATAAIATCRHAGVGVENAVRSLQQFAGVKRRLEWKGKYRGISIYDDFAHHPTEIAATLAAFRSRFPERRIVAVFEPRSNSMQMGAHRSSLAASFDYANELFVLQADTLQWSVADNLNSCPVHIESSVDRLVQRVSASLRKDDCVLILSNGSFGGFCNKLIKELQAC